MRDDDEFILPFFRIVHPTSLELSFLSSPTGPSTPHRTAREVSECAT